MSNLANIAIGLIVVGLLLVRQLQPRPAREASSIRLVLILGAAGIFEISKAVGHHHLTAATVAWLAVSLAVGAVTGAIRAATVRVWRAQDGSAWRQGTMLTAALWLISLGAHLALDTVIDHASWICCGVHGRIADGCSCCKDGRCAQLRRSVCTVGVSADGHGRPRWRRFRVEVNGGAGRASRLADRRSASLPGTRAAGTGPVTGVRLFPRRALLGRPPAPRTLRYPGRQRARRHRRMAAGGQCSSMRAITERD